MKKITLFLFCGLLGFAGIFYSCEDTIEEDPNDEEEVLEQSAWTRHPDNPVMDNGGMGNWDHPRTQAASVIFNGSNYDMWYGGGLFMAWKIGYASSPDGIQWERDANNPVLNVGAAGAWDDKFVAFPSVMYDSTSLKYKMWYHGRDSKEIAAIGYAEKDTN